MTDVNKVYFIENIDPYNTRCGGIGTYLRNLVLYLKERKVFTVLIGAGNPTEQSEPDIQTDRFIAVTSSRKSHPYYILSLFFKVWKLSLAPGSILHGQRPDVLFPFVLFGRHRRDKRLICSLHSIQSRTIRDKRGKWWSLLYRYMERKTLNNVDAIIAVGTEVDEYLKEHYPGIMEKIVMLPAGADDHTFHSLENPGERLSLRQSYGFNESDKIMMFAGRLEKEKNLILLINAFSLVKKKIPNVKFLIVGSGRQEAYLKSYVKEKGETGIIFYGSAARAEMPLLLNCADVFTLASFYESGPIVVREALACNLAVVSTDVGDARSLIQELPGCFISREDPHEFSQKVISSLSYDGPREYRQAISDYRNESIFQKTLSLYAFEDRAADGA